MIPLMSIELLLDDDRMSRAAAERHALLAALPRHASSSRHRFLARFWARSWALQPDVPRPYRLEIQRGGST